VQNFFAFDWRAAEKPDPLALRFKCKRQLPDFGA
jgi:hypothetical protein